MKYGSGISFAAACKMELEQIKMALMGQLVCGEDESGFHYQDAPKEACDQFIVDTYKESVHQAKLAMVTSRALERILEEKVGAIGKGCELEEFLKYYQKELLETFSNE